MKNIPIPILISANTEYKALCRQFENINQKKSPFGKYFETNILYKDINYPVLFFHGGWGKICAAASVQYIIDKWNHSFVISIGTCGGFKGYVQVEDVILANKTIVYDIIEEMDNPEEAVTHYSSKIDLSWLPKNELRSVKICKLLSADKDLQSKELNKLIKHYKGVAGDWESGAIAHIAKLNNKNCIILKGVSDLVDDKKGEAYGNMNLYSKRTCIIMKKVLQILIEWLPHINHLSD